MDYVVSYNEIAALVANPPSLAPLPNVTNLRNLRRHIQHALMRVSCPQSNILGWAGLIMSRAMYGIYNVKSSTALMMASTTPSRSQTIPPHGAECVNGTKGNV